MPAPILLQAALDGVSGDPLLAQRLAGALVAVPLYGLGYVILRRFEVGRVLAIGLLACVLATPAGFAAALDGGADQLAVLCQLGALALVFWSTGRRAAAAAGALCALALLAKLTAIWAVVAIALVLLVRERRRALPFLATYVIVAAALLGATEFASRGRFTDNVLALGGSGFEGLGAVGGEAPGRVLMIAQDFDQAVWLLAPLAVLALARAVTAKGIDVFHVAWLAAVAVLVVTLADIGAWFNHTLDLAFLTVLLAARVTAGSDSASVTLRAVATVTVAIGLAGAIFTPADGTFSPRAALVSLAHRETGSVYPARPLAGIVSILHRVSGVLMFLLMPFIIWMFDTSLSSEISFARFKAAFNSGLWFFPGWFIKLVALGLIWAYLHHFIAGLRHLWMDVSHAAVSKEFGMRSAQVTLVASVLLTLVLGAKLFGLY